MGSRQRIPLHASTVPRVYREGGVRLLRKECLRFFMRYNILRPGSEEMRDIRLPDENARNHGTVCGCMFAARLQNSLGDGK